MKFCGAIANAIDLSLFAPEPRRRGFLPYLLLHIVEQGKMGDVLEMLFCYGSRTECDDAARSPQSKHLILKWSIHRLRSLLPPLTEFNVDRDNYHNS